MLTHLSIRNVVLIESAEIPFDEGLCVLTGETGAGKSILLDALGLALGERAAAQLVRHGERQASVTACFDISHATRARETLIELGFNPEDELVIRRSLSNEGKSRCFINDQPVSVTGLKRLGEALVEIHGQHDQRGLLDMRTHLDLLDAYGGLEESRALTAAAYDDWQAIRDELTRLQRLIEQAEREQDYLRHLVDELDALDAQPGEADALTEARTVMMQGEKLSNTFHEALAELQSGSIPVEAALNAAQRLLLRSNLPGIAQGDAVIEALERAQHEVQLATQGLERLLEEGAYNPQELERTEERLFAIKAAARKYQVEPDGLAALREDAREKLGTLDTQQHRMAALIAAQQEAENAYLAHANQLSEARGLAAQRLQKTLITELDPLKMSKCRFRVVQEELPREHWGPRGTDHVRFEAATNAGQAYAPLHKIASGGELSRFMLALKVVLASLKSTSTLIFDEIDTGTGGAVADAIGARLALLSDNAQILVVTHLPQVAARGNHHLFIAKSTREDTTHTAIRVLDVAERKEELARMLAGAEVTEEARGAAQKLMEAAG